MILDDFGLHPMDEEGKLILLEFLEDRYTGNRYGQQATLITSQFPSDKWYGLIAKSDILLMNFRYFFRFGCTRRS
ncbi:MAG: hypothetical protein ACREOO_24745 [bacterium]